MELKLNTNFNQEGTIFISRDLVQDLSQYSGVFLKYQKAVIVTDKDLGTIYEHHLKEELEKFCLKVSFLTLSLEEKKKDLKNVSTILDSMWENSLSCGDVLISFGGSIISDLCRMASGLYLGGIDLILFPTTLASQVHNSIGFEYSINLNDNKNILCVPKLPRFVFIDPNLLITSTDSSFYEGMIYVIKYALILDKRLFERLETYSKEEIRANINKIIVKCINDKIKLLRTDSFGKCLKGSLALGNGVGSFVYSEFNQDQSLKKAHALAIGMYCSALKSDKLLENDMEISTRLRKLFHKFNIGFDVPTFDISHMESWLESNKYIRSDTVDMILLDDIGSTYIKKIEKKNFAKFWFE